MTSDSTNHLNDSSVLCTQVKPPKPLTKQQQAFRILTENGFKPAQAYQFAGFKGKDLNSSPYKVQQAIRHKILDTPAMVNLAKRAIKETIAMQPQVIEKTIVKKNRDGTVEVQKVEEKLYPTHSERLDAAREVLDRADPKVQKSMSMNVNSKVDFIDLSQYSNF